MQIQTILDQIDLKAMALPGFQRGYVLELRTNRRVDVLVERPHESGMLVSAQQPLNSWWLR